MAERKTKSQIWDEKKNEFTNQGKLDFFIPK